MRKTTIFLIILSIILISGAGCQIDDKLSKEGSPSKCPDNIIPERLDLKYNENSKYYDYSYYTKYEKDNPIRKITLKWLDGTDISSWEMFQCHKGGKEGENINYIYCDYFYWGKTPISEEGVVQKEIEYLIRLVLDLNDHTEEGYKLISKQCKQIDSSKTSTWIQIPNWWV